MENIELYIHFFVKADERKEQTVDKDSVGTCVLTLSCLQSEALSGAFLLYYFKINLILFMAYLT